MLTEWKKNWGLRLIALAMALLVWSFVRWDLR